MVSSGVHSLKLLLTFAAATSSAVFVGVQMHQPGSGAEVRSAGMPNSQATAPPPLPILVDAPVSPPASPRPPIAPMKPVVVASAEPQPAEVLDAIPVTEALLAPQAPATPAPKPIAKPVAPSPAATQSLAASAALPIAEARPIEVGMLSLRDSYEPFTDSLTDVLRKEVPKALPLPMVYQAVILNDNEWLRQLLKAGFVVNDPTPSGETALCAAIKARNQEAVELLLLHGADPHMPGRDGLAPLALTCLMRTERIIPALLSAGADPNTTYKQPMPEEMLKELPFPDLCSSLRHDRQVTVLMAVSARGDTEGVIALLQYGAKASQPTKKYYRYPINYAADAGYLFIMRLLLGRPADSEPDVLVTVDLSQQKAYLSQFGEIIDKTSVSTGREGYSTPEGRYVVTDKHASWTSTIYHVEMPWFMRLNCGAIGLHAGYVTGSPASHGCIRLPYDKVKKWFGIVKVGDDVQIVR